MTNFVFRNSIARNIFDQKYKHEGAETWPMLADTLAEDVIGPYYPRDVVRAVADAIREMKIIPGGRYLYYAGRPRKYFNNCFLFRSEADTKEDWAELSWKAERALTTGGGIGNDYSIYRGRGTPLKSSGGLASGPISKMMMINEIGRHVMQGGSRRSAIYASLSDQHTDVMDFIHAKDWDSMPLGTSGLSYGDIKRQDFNFPAPLDMTNISVNFGDEWLSHYQQTGDVGPVFHEVVKQAMKTGEPGFSFNFGDKANETLRNACTEVTSEDDSDVCNLGSINLANIDSLEEFRTMVELMTIFLLCGTIRAHLPYDKVYKVRDKNRRLGVGLMGIHEWLLKRSESYRVTPELHKWLHAYREVSDIVAAAQAAVLGVSEPVARRAIAPTGSIGMLAGTTTGIEPLFAVAYKRRYLTNGTDWVNEYVVDSTANRMVQEYGIDPDTIETSMAFAREPERRLEFQADVQDYVDMSISSTINLPQWGTELNNEDRVHEFGGLIAKYAHRLRGVTLYPDGSRGGQPLTAMRYQDCIGKEGEKFVETYVDVCDITGKGGTCGA